MSSIKYATEDNIRSLILLIKNELEGYVTKDWFDSKIKEELSGYITLKKVFSLPDYGESNVIYLLRTEDMGSNIYDEYFWDEEESRFEMIGPTINDVPGSEVIPSITFEKVPSLPDRGKPNVIYLILNSEMGSNIYDEYFWDEETSRFEMIGPVDMGQSDMPIPDSEIDNIF